VTARADKFSPGHIRFVLFDLAGTTVSDGNPGTSLVVEALQKTLQSAGVTLDIADITSHRGKDKRAVIRELLQRTQPNVSDALVDELLDGFLLRLEQGLSEFAEISGASRTFEFLHGRGIQVGIGSGFPQELVDRIVARFGWKEQGLVDYAASTETVGAGRPHPAMIRDAMKRFTITDPQQVLKVGDTIMDILEGRNAGAWTVAVLTGTQLRATLESAGPDFILKSVAELPDLFGESEQ
jgi:phosphonatase-like hydrolase